MGVMPNKSQTRRCSHLFHDQECLSIYKFI